MAPGGWAFREELDFLPVLEIELLLGDVHLLGNTVYIDTVNICKVEHILYRPGSPLGFQEV